MKTIIFFVVLCYGLANTNIEAQEIDPEFLKTIEFQRPNDFSGVHFFQGRWDGKNKEVKNDTTTYLDKENNIVGYSLPGNVTPVNNRYYNKNWELLGYTVISNFEIFRYNNENILTSRAFFTSLEYNEYDKENVRRRGYKIAIEDKTGYVPKSMCTPDGCTTDNEKNDNPLIPFRW